MASVVARRLTTRRPYARPRWVLAALGVVFGIFLAPVLAAALAHEPRFLSLGVLHGSSQIATLGCAATSVSLFALIGFALGCVVEVHAVHAATDGLTQVFNRTSLEAKLETEASLVGDGAPLSLLVVDVDHLKAINQREGRSAGDGALRTVADLLAGGAHSRDWVGRWGDDEFVVVMPRTSAAEALVIAGRAHRALGALSAYRHAAAPALALSIGVAESNAANPLSASALYEAAERAMHRAKTKPHTRTSLAAGPTTAATPPSIPRSPRVPKNVGRDLDEESEIRVVRHPPSYAPKAFYK